VTIKEQGKYSLRQFHTRFYHFLQAKNIARVSNVMQQFITLLFRSLLQSRHRDLKCQQTLQN
jgi:hypothetical protein